VSASLMRRSFFLAGIALALAAAALPAWAADIVVDVYLGTGEGTVPGLRNPRAVLNGGDTVDGLPIRRRGGTVAVLPWDTMKHLAFIPGDIPTVIISYRDRSEIMVDVEPCRIVVDDRSLDIHDIAEISIRGR